MTDEGWVTVIIDWPVLFQRGKKSLPRGTVTVSLTDLRTGDRTTEDWPGEIVGELALVTVPVPRSEPDNRYQVIHRPTGLYVVRAPAPMYAARALLLALAESGIDWAGWTEAGVIGRPDAEVHLIRHLIHSWRAARGNGRRP